MICQHCVVSGLVQGVFFRASTRDQALKLGLGGWVKNLPDGQVELMVCGDEKKLHLFHQWLEQGPEYARVEKVVCKTVACDDGAGFKIK